MLTKVIIFEWHRKGDGSCTTHLSSHALLFATHLWHASLRNYQMLSMQPLHVLTAVIDWTQEGDGHASGTWATPSLCRMWLLVWPNLQHPVSHVWGHRRQGSGHRWAWVLGALDHGAILTWWQLCAYVCLHTSVWDPCIACVPRLELHVFDLQFSLCNQFSLCFIM
jgi:hypothetical protein